jgi:hypothetical protein
MKELTHLYTHLDAQTCTCMHTCTRVHTHTHTYAYIHTYINTSHVQILYVSTRQYTDLFHHPFILYWQFHSLEVQVSLAIVHFT